MILIGRARRYILNHITPLPAATVPAGETLGLVLAEDVRADGDVPPFRNSAMDGYAVRSADTRGASRARPALLRLAEVVPAGKTPSRTVRPGTAAKIMTGAVLPRGADAVLIVERAAERGRTVLCFAEARRGENVRRAGEDIPRGGLVLRRGAVVRPQEMGMIAAAGRTAVRAVPRPRVAILATGSELVRPGRAPGPGRIRNCNNLSLAGLVRTCGADPVDLGIVPDDPALVRRALLAARGFDMLLLSGGVSVGEYDVVRRVLSRVGTAARVWQVRVKPGKPLAFGLLGRMPVFGLPGNPVSVMVSFELFVRPALLAMAGRRPRAAPVVGAALDGRIENDSGRVFLVRARVTRAGGRLAARPVRGQGSGILMSMVRANGLIVVPARARRVRRGAAVRVMLFDPVDGLPSARGGRPA